MDIDYFRTSVLTAILVAILFISVGPVNVEYVEKENAESNSTENGWFNFDDKDFSTEDFEESFNEPSSEIKIEKTAVEEIPDLTEPESEEQETSLEPETIPVPEMPEENTKSQTGIDSISGYFVENSGQIGDDEIKFYIPGGGIWFTSSGVMFEIPDKESTEKDENSMMCLKQEFLNANRVDPEGTKKMEHHSNFFYGSNPEEWYSDISNYEEIFYMNLYEKIDLRYYISGNGLKYDFIVHPGGNPEDIMIKYHGANEISVNDDNDLVIHTDNIELIDGNLYIYQEQPDGEHEVMGEFSTYSREEYGFYINDEYDIDHDLIIDPELSYSTFVGGNSFSFCGDIDVDRYGYAYVTGHTMWMDFPTTPGAYDRSYNNVNTSGYPPPSYGDVVVFKLNHNGSGLIYSTYIGGNDGDRGFGIEIDKDGNAYITGETKSSDFPTTPGAYDRSFAQQTLNTKYDSFVLKLNNNGSKLIYSTFVGGSSHDSGSQITIDELGCAYVVGKTYLSGFPTTAGAYDTTSNGQYDAFVMKLNPTGSSLVFSTYIGGKLDDGLSCIKLDPMNNIVLAGSTSSSDFPVTSGAYKTAMDTYTGSDSVIIKLNNNGSKLLYSTFVGGKRLDYTNDVEVDSSGNIYIAGGTRSSDFPTTGKTFATTPADWNDDHVFISKLDGNLSKMLHSTVIGGKSIEWALGIELDGSGNVIAYGDTDSTDFPITKDPIRDFYHGNTFLLKLNYNFSEITYSTSIGNASFLRKNIGLDHAGNVYLTGNGNSKDFPTTEGAFDTEANTLNFFVMKIKMVDNSPPVITSFTASTAVEGSPTVFSVSASDPENDILTYSFDLDLDGIYEVVGKKNTVSRIWYDDHNGYASVLVSDGYNNVYATTTVTVSNTAPVADIQVTTINNTVSAVMSVRISGEKWHDVNVKLYEDDNLIVEDSLTRKPGDPDEQKLDLSDHKLSSSGKHHAVLTYTPEDDKKNGNGNGATPCWIILECDDGKEIKLHHTFNAKHENTHVWTADISEVIGTGNSTCEVSIGISIKDPGTDILTIVLDTGDGMNNTMIYLNPNNTAPSTFVKTMVHTYSSPGTYTITLWVKDDNGGETKIEIICTV